MEDKKSLIKVEGNLIEYPFFHLGGQRKKVYSKSYDLPPIKNENIIISDRQLLVENFKYGIPGPYDQDVLMGILKIGTIKNKLTEDIPLTVYEVAKEIDDLKNQARVKESIFKIATTNYYSKQGILVKESGTNYYINELFHIIESAFFLDEKEKNKRISNKVTKVRFNNYFISNFLNDYYKYIDLKKYFSIGSPTAKKLFLYLEKKKYRKETFQIKIDNLAGVLPLEVTKYNEIRKILKKASEKLIEHFIINSFGFEKDKVHFFFPSKEEKKQELKENPLEEKLVSLGITRITAQDLIRKYDEYVIKEQIEYLNFRKGDNLQGLLITAIKENWAVPSEYTIKKQQEAIQEEIRKKSEEKKRAEENQKVLDSKIEDVFKSLSKEEIFKYNKMAEEYFIKESPELGLKYFPQAYREVLIKRIMIEDKGLCFV